MSDSKRGSSGSPNSSSSNLPLLPIGAPNTPADSTAQSKTPEPVPSTSPQTSIEGNDDDYVMVVDSKTAKKQPFNIDTFCEENAEWLNELHLRFLKEENFILENSTTNEKFVEEAKKKAAKDEKAKSTEAAKDEKAKDEKAKDEKAKAIEAEITAAAKEALEMMEKSKLKTAPHFKRMSSFSKEWFLRTIKLENGLAFLATLPKLPNNREFEPDLIRYAIKHTGDLNAKLFITLKVHDSKGHTEVKKIKKTALEIATINGHVSIVECLLSGVLKPKKNKKKKLQFDSAVESKILPDDQILSCLRFLLQKSGASDLNHSNYVMCVFIAHLLPYDLLKRLDFLGSNPADAPHVSAEKIAFWNLVSQIFRQREESIFADRYKKLQEKSLLIFWSHIQNFKPELLLQQNDPKKFLIDFLNVNARKAQLRTGFVAFAHLFLEAVTEAIGRFPKKGDERILQSLKAFREEIIQKVINLRNSLPLEDFHITRLDKILKIYPPKRQPKLELTDSKLSNSSSAFYQKAPISKTDSSSTAAKSYSSHSASSTKTTAKK